MPGQWAKNDWIASDSISHTKLNDIGNSIRTWGYGETAGSVTINANSNALSNLGTLTFGTAGGVADGSLSAPGLRFAADQNTGLYRSAADTVDIVTGGASRVQVNSTAAILTGSVGIGSSTAPSYRLSVAASSSAWNDALSGIASACIGMGVGLTDYGLRTGFNTASPGPYAWMQAIKPGTANYPLLINANGGQVVLRCDASVNDNFIVPNTFTAYLDEATNTLKFRVMYSGGTLKTGSVALT